MSSPFCCTPTGRHEDSNVAQAAGATLDRGWLDPSKDRVSKLEPALAAGKADEARGPLSRRLRVATPEFLLGFAPLALAFLGDHKAVVCSVSLTEMGDPRRCVDRNDLPPCVLLLSCSSCHHAALPWCW